MEESMTVTPVDLVDEHEDPEKVAMFAEQERQLIAERVDSVNAAMQDSGASRKGEGWLYPNGAIVRVGDAGTVEVAVNTASEGLVTVPVSASAETVVDVASRMGELASADRATVTIEGEVIDLPLDVKLVLMRAASATGDGPKDFHLDYQHEGSASASSDLAPPALPFGA